MNIHESFPSRFLKPHDLGVHAPQVVIREVQSVATFLAGKKVTKLVVFFIGKDKGLLLNKTNAVAIAGLAGSPDTEAWRGCKIRIFATTTKFGDQVVPCVRVKAVA